MTNFLILISDRPEDRSFVQVIADQCQLELKQFPTALQAAKFISDQSVAAVFVDVADESDYRKFEKSIETTIGLYSDQLNSNQIHYLCEQNVQDLEYLFQSPIFGNFVFRNFSKDLQNSAERYARVVSATLQEKAFGIQGLLRPERSKVQTIQFKKTTQKQDGVEAVKNYLIAGKFKTRMATVIANAVDELIMNAMFDAPMDALGKPLHSTTPRNTLFEIDSDRPVELQIGFDGDYAVISAIDHYGSLDKSKLFKHITKNYFKEAYKVKTTTAGAGIGLVQVYRSGGSFLFMSEKGVKTEVVVFFKRTANYKEFKDQFRFISTQFYF